MPRNEADPTTADECDGLNRACMLIASRLGVDPDLLHYREYHWWIDRDGSYAA